MKKALIILVLLLVSHGCWKASMHSFDEFIKGVEKSHKNFEEYYYKLRHL